MKQIMKLSLTLFLIFLLLATLSGVLTFVTRGGGWTFIFWATFVYLIAYVIELLVWTFSEPKLDLGDE